MHTGCLRSYKSNENNIKLWPRDTMLPPAYHCTGYVATCKAYDVRLHTVGVQEQKEAQIATRVTSEQQCDDNWKGTLGLSIKYLINK